MTRNTPRPARPAALLTLPAVLALVAACGTGSGGAVTTEAGGSSVVTSGAGTSGSSGAGTDLTVVYRDGNGHETTWTLTCDPPGGSHPDPAAACRALTARGADALPPVAAGMMCTQIYGGPQQATITGTWRGEQVRSVLKRSNGCEIARWNNLAGLLPAEGVGQ